MATTNEKIGKKIKIARMNEGISQEILAEKLDLALRTVSDIERGKVGITIKTIEKLSEIFGLPIKYFFDFNFATFNKSDEQRIKDINEDLSVASKDELKEIEKRIKVIVYKQ